MEPSLLLPMFPLGSVVFPTGAIPLRVFEPRYRRLVADCLDGDRRFGIVLIERGSEVGGGDERFGVGTVVRIEEVAPLPGEHLALIAIGERRLQVEEWLDDDPYPRARVHEMTEYLGSAGPDLAGPDLVDRTAARLQRVYGLLSETGIDVGAPTLEFDSDPVVASFQMCVAAPVGSLDAQRLLEEGSASSRLVRLGEMLDEVAALLEYRLRGA